MARPRKHKPGTTAAERVAMSTQALKDSGGARKTFRLGPQAVGALEELKRKTGPKTTETKIVEGALIDAADRAKD